MLNILQLEDQPQDAYLIEQALADHDIKATFIRADDRPDFIAALDQGEIDLVLTDSALPRFDGIEALKVVRQKFPHLPVIVVSSAITNERASLFRKAGADHYLSKDNLGQLVDVVRKEQEKLQTLRMNRGMRRLVAAVQELSLARNLDTIMDIVRQAARELTGADGATFVLRENEQCYYADENAIAPLWKGQRFPLQVCISGWAMLNRQPAVIEDIYLDSRIPVDAYRPTFVKSLVMVPIRTEAPIGAIGNYWAKQRQPLPEEVELLQALANTTAVAMENVQVYGELEKRVKDRTAELEMANQELETFSYAVSHDLNAPLRRIRGFADIVFNDCAEKLDEKSRRHLDHICTSAQKMSFLIEDLLKLARFSRTPLRKVKVSLSQLAQEIVANFKEASPDRHVNIQIANGMEVDGDAGLLQAALENLLSNAWKYSSKVSQPSIEFGSTQQSDGTPAYFIRDNGAGFDMQYAGKLFQPFQRLHGEHEFTGTGVGLATVHRIIQRHGGRIWVEAAVNKGATFYFTIN